ncbi:MAG: EamA family transporter [Anaerolineales bacterium]|jgi:drug/metabolite transporter (DMT)-like permease
MRSSRISVGGQSKGVAIALVGTFCWSTTSIIMRTLLSNTAIAPLTLAVWRDVVVALALGAVLSLAGPTVLRIRVTDVPFLLLHGGVALAAMNGLWTFSVAMNGAALATVLVYVAPAINVLIGWLFLHEGISGWKVCAVALGITGVALIATLGRGPTVGLGGKGILVGVGTGAAFALFGLTGKIAAKRFANTWTATFYGFVFAAAALFLLQKLTHSPGYPLRPRELAGLALLALPTLLGYGLFSASLRHLSTTVASLVASLEPALTAAMAVTLLGERMLPGQWIGGGLILGGVFLTQVAPPEQERPPLPEAPEPLLPFRRGDPHL